MHYTTLMRIVIGFIVGSSKCVANCHPDGFASRKNLKRAVSLRIFQPIFCRRIALTIKESKKTPSLCEYNQNQKRKSSNKKASKKIGWHNVVRRLYSNELILSLGIYIIHKYPITRVYMAEENREKDEESIEK